MEVDDLSVKIQGNPLFSNLGFTVGPGTRIGLVGRNGCGKSILLNVLHSCAQAGQVPEQGRVRVADGLAVVNFAQDRGSVNQQDTLRRALAPEGDSIVFRDRSVHVVSWAKRFLFRPDQLDTPVDSLSGGEQARILIAELMRQPADILLLDEPTNDLDIASLDVSEESLLDFGGAVILVTHDRYLLDRVCDRILGFWGDGEIGLFSDYEQWFKKVSAGSKKLTQDLEPIRKKPAEKKRKQGRLSYLDQREYDQMEKKILAGEQSCEELEELIKDPALATDPEKLQSVWQQLDTARQEVEPLYLRWDELERKKMQ